MTDKQRMYCLSEVSSYTDRDAYVSDLALDTIWGDNWDDDIPEERIESLRILWDAYNRDVRSICNVAGISQRSLAERFCIPYRTVEDWCRGVRTPPDYVRLMMQQLLDLL